MALKGPQLSRHANGIALLISFNIAVQAYKVQMLDKFKQ